MGGYLTREEKDHWKDEILENRMLQFDELLKWLNEEKIPFTKNVMGIEVNFFQVYFDMKVKFSGTRKSYQYNLEKIKERILQ